MTTPSVAAGPPGNCAYPSNPPPRLQTQRFRYRSLGQAAWPPAFARFTESPVPNESRVVFVRVIPVVFLPAGSFLARANWMFASVTSPVHTPGTMLLSALLAR